MKHFSMVINRVRFSTQLRDLYDSVLLVDSGNVVKLVIGDSVYHIVVIDESEECSDD